MTSQVTRVLIAALGGEGGGVLAEWLVQCAQHAGLVAQATSVPGVAQRTGSTSYYIEWAAATTAPVLALSPMPGRVDVVVASEWLETARMMERGFVTPELTTLIASTSRVFTTQEKMHGADGRFDPQRIRTLALTLAKHAVLMDMEALTIEHQTVVSAVMFGAMAGAGVLPWGDEVSEAVIRASGKGVKASLAAYAAAKDEAGKANPVKASPVNPSPVNPSPVIANEVKQSTSLEQTTGDGSPRRSAPRDDGSVGERPSAPRDDGLVGEGPSAPRDDGSVGAGHFAPHDDERSGVLGQSISSLIELGAQRCEDYQDARYAEEFRQRVREALPEGPLNAAQTALWSDAIRQLALWMCFEDVVRVADLKTRPDRLARIRREAQADPQALVHVTEHFKPGVDEIASILPASWGQRLLAWAEKRPERSRHMGLHIRTTSLWGYLMLRAMARLRPWRRSSLRFTQEHVAIDGWWSALAALSAPSTAMGQASALTDAVGQAPTPSDAMRQASAPSTAMGQASAPSTAMGQASAPSTAMGQASAPSIAMGQALAQLPQVLKGYGDTQKRGREHYERLWSEFVAPALAGQMPLEEASRKLQQALTATLAKPDAQVPTSQVHPIRWFKQRPV